MPTRRDQSGRFASKNGAAFQGMLRSGKQSEETDRPSVCVDILDRMHGKAKQGATLATMIRAFPECNPDMVEYWFRQNGYMLNGTKRIHETHEARSVRAQRRQVRERLLWRGVQRKQSG